MIPCQITELLLRLVFIVIITTSFCLIRSEDVKDEDDKDKEIIECYVCASEMGDGSPNVNCLGNDTIKREITYITNCTTKCFVRTDDFNHGVPDQRLMAPQAIRTPVIYRGCPDVYYKMPSPLPEDGCYKWYLDVWCICSTSLCNYVALGEPMDIELDAHLPDDETGSSGGNKHTLSLYFGISSLVAIYGFML